MRLKEIKIHGFKSFPNKTILELSQGMTALVGPNGCGKSNVLDAIRWVLGEQKLSMLRCARNDDLIFAGSSRMSEQGYADVSLTVENEGDFPDLPADVEIRRRYYRTGESSFWINREECRLKEIESILRGGAAGGRLYSVFDASKLREIVSGDIHNLLESAAGVLGFRQKRKESERKLDLVRRDLIRLEDIITERKRIVRSLSRQRRRAELYRELRLRITELEAQMVRARYSVLVRELGGSQGVISSKEEEEKALLVSIEQIRKTLKGKDLELGKLLREEREARNALDDVSQKISDLSARSSACQARKEGVEENLIRINRVIDESKQRLTGIEEKINVAHQDLGKAVESREAAAEKLEGERKKLKVDEEELAGKRSEVRKKREILRTLTADLSNLVEERTNVRSRGENAASLAEGARGELTKLARRAEELKKSIEHTSGSLGEKNAQRTQHEKEILHLEKENRDAESQIQFSQRLRSEKIELAAKLAGQIASVKDRLEDKPRRQLKTRLGNRFRGLVESFFSCSAEFESALESILYDILGFASIAEIPNFEDVAIEGQAGLILDRDQKKLTTQRPSDRRFKAWIADNIKLKKGAPRILSTRLDSWVLVDKQDISTLAEKYPALNFVSADGTSLRCDGVALVGRPGGVLADRRRLRQLQSEASGNQEQISQLAETIDELEDKRDGFKRRLDESRRAFLEANSGKQSLEAELSRLDERRSELERERDRLRHEVNSREREAGDCQKTLAQLEAKISDMESSRRDTEADLAAMETELSKSEEELRDKLAGLNDHLLKLGKEEEAEHLVEERLKRLTEEQTSLKDTIESHQSEKKNLQMEISKLISDSEKFNKESAQLNGLREEYSRQVDQIDTKQLMEAKLEMETEFESRERELETMRGELVQLRTNFVLLLKEKGDLEKILSAAQFVDEVPAQDEAGEKLGSAEGSRILESAGIKDQGITDQADKDAPDATDFKVQSDRLEEVEREMIEVKGRLEQLGPVNEYAAVQYEEEKEELGKIKVQHDDVSRAAESLSAIIEQIDEEARSRFEVTFKAVRSEFRRTFNFFFPGGEADLRIENLDDPFNSPIHITARPEGKKLKRLTQLSDGERTMLGISLLFAFYAVRPAPFLFIDELDAPLDDNNVLKFASYLAHIKDSIQVFVITHNKRTMEKADSIYGVTMEEPGVSEIISVRLKDVKRHHVAVEEA